MKKLVLRMKKSMKMFHTVFTAMQPWHWRSSTNIPSTLSASIAMPPLGAQASSLFIKAAAQMVIILHQFVLVTNLS
jgi:hypothetical protein